VGDATGVVKELPQYYHKLTNIRYAYVPNLKKKTEGHLDSSETPSHITIQYFLQTT
jgi:hypothetical protein